MAKPDLDAIRARCEAATLGEWVSKKFGGYHHIYKGPIKVKGISMSHGGEICEMEYAGISDKTKKEINANALFIAYSRTDIPALLDYIDKLETELHDRRETELRPANKFLNNTPINQLTHVLSEIEEIQDVMIQLRHSKSDSDWQQLSCNLADEIYDAQSSLMTLAYICGLGRDDMIAAGKRKVQANAERGYYQETNNA